MSKAAAERYQKQVLALAKLPGNGQCAECRARQPRWAVVNLGIFVCMRCCGYHRKMGTHVSKVKSLTMDSWNKEMVAAMQLGNVASNAIYAPGRAAPTTSFDDSENDAVLEKFVRDKYEYKLFKIAAAPALAAEGVRPRSASPSSFSVASSRQSAASSTSNSRTSDSLLHPASASKQVRFLAPSTAVSPLELPALSPHPLKAEARPAKGILRESPARALSAPSVASAEPLVAEPRPSPAASLDPFSSLGDWYSVPAPPATPSNLAPFQPPPSPQTWTGPSNAFLPSLQPTVATQSVPSTNPFWSQPQPAPFVATQQQLNPFTQMGYQPYPVQQQQQQAQLYWPQGLQPQPSTNPFGSPPYVPQGHLYAQQQAVPLFHHGANTNPFWR